MLIYEISIYRGVIQTGRNCPVILVDPGQASSQYVTAAQENSRFDLPKEAADNVGDGHLDFRFCY